MNQNRHYLLVEGVNISGNIYDTNQLSVIRGGSFLLKDAIEHICETFNHQLAAISLGASSGLFALKNNSDAAMLRDAVAEELQTSTQYRLLTFIVVTCQADSLLTAREKLLTQLRIQQLQSITVVPEYLDGESQGASQWGGVRPLPAKADPIRYKGGQSYLVAASEKQRWQYGRDKKQDYYLGELLSLDLNDNEKSRYTELKEKLKEYGFTSDISEIADSRQKPWLDEDKPLYPQIDGKIAVFYADGNDFSKIQRSVIQAAGKFQQIDAQKNFDIAIRTHRGRLLASLLSEMSEIHNRHSSVFPHMRVNIPHESGTKPDALRFETLLWGGDELLFVMPAWIGFAFAQYFFQETQKWPPQGGQTLTHAAGLVFCHAKTPLSITRLLAQQIAERIKRDSKNRPEGKTDAWDYMVLESLDYPPHRDFSRYLKEHYGDAAAGRPIYIRPDQHWQKHQAMIPCLFALLATRQLYQLARLLTQNDWSQLFGEGTPWPPKHDQPGGEGHTPCRFEKAERRLLQVSEDEKALIEAIGNIAPLFIENIDDQRQRAWLWLHLTGLKDYIAPQERDHG